MSQTYNHNRDFNQPDSLRSGSHSWKSIMQGKALYLLAVPAIIAAVTLFPENKQGTDIATDLPYKPVAEKSINSEHPVAANPANSVASLKSFSPVVTAAASIAAPEDAPAAKAAIAPKKRVSGESFRELLEKSPDLWKTANVKKGDTLFIILKRMGLNVAAATLVANSENSKPLVRLSPGKTLHILSNDGAKSDAFVYENSPLTWVYASRNGDSYDISVKKLPTTTHLRKAKGEVISSLYAAAKVAGISDTLTMNMTEIFGWDIDFAINVQPGDRFKLIYEDIYVEGSKRAQGDILAAEFVNNGKTYRAIALRGDDGQLRYYSPDGRSMQKAFLRTPVKFSRISSRFSKARYHPVLKRTRAHKGVDYAAGRGTPIRATAAGRIVHAGRKGGYGNAVIISHGSTYSTLYAHMSRIARGIKKGAKVRQGQTIGQVGSTGLASGPHLHYEFRINGKHVNPLTFRQPASKPVQQAEKADFERSAHYWEEQLDNIDSLNITAGINSSEG